jgi:hypothetical protein
MSRSNKRIHIAILMLLTAGSGVACWMAGHEYGRDKNTPEPRVVEPGNSGQPPSDAVILFDGRDLLQWSNGENWLVQDGAAIVGVGKGGITSKRTFGNCQLHLEWASPSIVEGSGQERGNSGVYLQERYELQVLDSYQNKTYFDGMAGAIYGQYPPLVNASRKPGEWQSYDVIFEAPRFNAQNRLLKPAFVTVLQNGILIQNHAEIKGDTGGENPPTYTSHPEKMPIHLQDHGCPVRYRNIWVREL